MRPRTLLARRFIVVCTVMTPYVAAAQGRSVPGAARAAPSAARPTSAAASAQDRETDESLPISGKVRPESEPADPARRLADVVLYLPRVAIDLLFVTSGAAAGLIDDEQVIPRLEDMFYSSDHTIGVFPTAFVETGFNPNVGARMIATSGDFAATLRGGYGGADAHVIESRMRVTVSSPTPGAFSIEALHDRRTDLGYVGLGPVPESDARNTFQADSALRVGAYREVRERLIGNFGFRPLADTELLLSTSYRRRRVDDAPDAGEGALGRVFAPGSVPGAGRLNRTTYSEIAMRYDTRLRRGAPTSGWMMEGYAGVLRGIHDADGDGLSLGGRAGVFLPIYRRSNILTPRIAIDTTQPSDASTFAFLDYPTPADYRGIDPRRDRVAIVGSLDYRWVIMKYVATRIFMDTSTVAPDFPSIDLHHLRYAWGMGMDLHSTHTEIARIAASASAEGFRFFFSLGVAPSGFGDRQHR